MEPSLNCLYSQTSIFPNYLFTIAILMNACRWLILVMSLKQQENEGRAFVAIQKRELAYKIIFFTLTVVMFAITVVRLHYACAVSIFDENQTRVKLINAWCLMAVNVIPIVVYLYVGIFMRNYTKRLIEQ